MGTLQKSRITYSVVREIDNYGDRLNLLQQSVRDSGYQNPDRGISNGFYKSREWLELRDKIIARDLGCDLGLYGNDIDGPILVHHIDPLTDEDFIEYNIDKLLNPENLICVSIETHNTIHYGNEKQNTFVERSPGDTKLW